ncbi:phage portal protein [Lactococcus sp.]|uniref:phage portal protein n=1 Tax=Lactococcus sp. TaxID=44273 RepID=UPI0035ADCC76
MGVVQSLNKITDHPKIAINPKEYDRIANNLKYFEGHFPDIQYRNTYGKIKTRPYNSLNMAKVTAHRLASIIFNEQMQFEVKGNETANQFAHDTLTNNGFLKNFETYLESALALGGLAMRPYFDGDKIDISYIQAPVFFPLQSNTNDVSEAAIVTVSTQAVGNKTYYYTLIEFHEWDGDKYTITNELYQSEYKEQVGVRVALNTMYEGLQDQSVVNSLTRPLFVYMKPFGMNNKDITSPLGLSIYDNAKNTLKQINDTYDQFNWEVKLGQRRIGVTEDMLSTKVDENDNIIQFFDSDQNIFVNTGDGVDGAKVGDMTSPIRSNDYITAMNQFLKTLEMEVGLSTGSFSFDGQGVKTATEVISENSMTYQTRNSHLSSVERAIKELIISILELAQGTITTDGTALYTGDIPTLDDISINFDDGVFLDKTSELDYWAKMAAAGFTSKQYAMQRLGIPEDKITEIMAQIQQEQQPPMGTTDMSMFAGN